MLVMYNMVDRTQLVVAIHYLYSLPQRNGCEIKELWKITKNAKRSLLSELICTALYKQTQLGFPQETFNMFDSL